ncbi:hypothetical protein O9929_08735 [Vibrio lentus]|nr:hypothetical protein [Vibrio lentus]
MTLVTIEENAIAGGAGAGVIEFLMKEKATDASIEPWSTRQVYCSRYSRRTA